jgi:hypothetical protein
MSNSEIEVTVRLVGSAFSPSFQSRVSRTIAAAGDMSHVGLVGSQTYGYVKEDFIDLRDSNQASAWQHMNEWYDEQRRRGIKQSSDNVQDNHERVQEEYQRTLNAICGLGNNLIGDTEIDQEEAASISKTMTSYLSALEDALKRKDKDAAVAAAENYLMFRKRGLEEMETSKPKLTTPPTSVSTPNQVQSKVTNITPDMIRQIFNEELAKVNQANSNSNKKNMNAPNTSCSVAS